MKSDDYTKRLTINAPIEDAFAAISTVKGLQSWWTEEASGSGEAGGALRFSFSGRTVTHMHVDEARAPERVVWTCTSSGLNEWAGTRITFDLTPDGPGATTLNFTHYGLQPHLGCFEMCEAGWNTHLQHLAEYAATGHTMIGRTTADRA